MRALAVAALLIAACGGEGLESNFPAVPSGLYRIEGGDLFCDGGSIWYTEPEAPPHLVVVCAWECLRVEGRDVRRVDLTFRRDSDVSPWRHSFTNWTFGSCAP